MVGISGLRGIYGDGLTDEIAEKFAYSFGKTYNGLVDDNNVFEKGVGNFDTADQLMFSTDASFRVTAQDCNDIYNGTFENGGNEPQDPLPMGFPYRGDDVPYRCRDRHDQVDR